jgi:hypothetical protein
MKKYVYTLVFLFLFTGCADVSPHAAECVTSNPYGFFSGFWHGMIIFFSFIGSIFSDDIAIYAYNNSGGWYDFGFLLGLGSFGSGITITIKT